MSFHITDPDGITRIAPPLAEWDELLERFSGSEAGDVFDIALTHESGWQLCYYSNGAAVLEDLTDSDCGDERVLRNVSRERLLVLWKWLSEGEIGRVKDVFARGG